MRILENGEYKYTWQQEKQMLEDAFARQLLIKYNIKEVTTQRQAKNGTREFEFPVSALAPKTRYGRVNPNQFPKLRLACFKTGYVRKQNGCYSPYQVNKTYNQNRRHTYFLKTICNNGQSWFTNIGTVSYTHLTLPTKA